MLYQALGQLPDHELVKNRAMLFDNILTLLNHVYTMDVVWQANLTGKEHGMTTRNPPGVPLFADLCEKQRQINGWFEDYADSLTSTEQCESVGFSFIGGGEGLMLKSEILQHVVNHASYHRGHIEGVLYSMPVKPPTTDLPVFMRNFKSLMSKAKTA